MASGTCSMTRSASHQRAPGCSRERRRKVGALALLHRDPEHTASLGHRGAEGHLHLVDELERRRHPLIAPPGKEGRLPRKRVEQTGRHARCSPTGAKRIEESDLRPRKEVPSETKPREARPNDRDVQEVSFGWGDIVLVFGRH